VHTRLDRKTNNSIFVSISWFKEENCMNLLKFDRRIVARSLEKGLVSEKEYEKYLGSLPDLEGEYDIIDIPLYETEEDGSAENAGEESASEAKTDDGYQPEGV